MAEVKKKVPVLVTPKGVAKFAWLNKPDTKYKAEGEYHVTLAFDADVFETAPIKSKDPALNGKSLKQLIEETTKAAVAEAKKENPKVAKQIKAGNGYTMETDDEGNETGRVLVNVKMKASFKDKKTQEEVNIKPVVYSADRQELKNPPLIYGGSTLKALFTLSPYYVAGQKTAGCTLRLRGVQIIELAERSGGYEDLLDDEEGYTADESMTDEPGTDEGNDGGDEDEF